MLPECPGHQDWWLIPLSRDKASHTQNFLTERKKHIQALAPLPPPHSILTAEHTAGRHQSLPDPAQDPASPILPSGGRPEHLHPLKQQAPLLTFCRDAPAMHQCLVRSLSLIPQKPRRRENAPATASVRCCCIISTEREKMPEIAAL